MSGNEWVVVEGTVRGATQWAVTLEVEDGRVVHVPFSQIEQGYDLAYPPGETVELRVKEWLARKEDLV